MTTTILAKGKSWTLRRDGDGPEVLEFRECRNWSLRYEGDVLALNVPPDLAALLTPKPGVTGEVVFVGDYRNPTDFPMMTAGQPCMIVACTREALKTCPSLVYRQVYVTPQPEDRYATTL
jgi:hypothetical protein